MTISVDFCALHGCKTSEATCNRKAEYGCAGCTELRSVPKFLVERFERW
jgi:hypothetical protein